MKKQFEYWLDQMCACLNVIDRAHRERKPLPYVSAFFEDCLEKGVDLFRRRCKNNGIGPQALGVATCADSPLSRSSSWYLMRRNTPVQSFSRRSKITGKAMRYFISSSTAPRCITTATMMITQMICSNSSSSYCKTLIGRPTIRGGQFNPGVYSVSGNVSMGLGTNASLDGRKKGEAISDNMGPVHTEAGSHDTKGPNCSGKLCRQGGPQPGTQRYAAERSFPGERSDRCGGKRQPVKLSWTAIWPMTRCMCSSTS